MKPKFTNSKEISSQLNGFLFQGLFFLFLTLSFASCLATKMAEALAQHQLTISQAARSDQNGGDKLEIIAETYVQVLDEALRFGSAKKAIKHVDTFSQQNEKDLDTIFASINSWMGDLSTTEKLLFGGKMATRPYTRQLIQLIPKFERKVSRRIKTFLFLSKLTKLVSLEHLIK